MRLIDADALIECIKDDLYNSYKDDQWYRLIANALIECINEQQTINAKDASDDPEVRRGHWITKDSKTAKCSCCGWWQHTKMYYLPDDISAFSKCYRFCTSCGERMDGDA